MSADGTSATLKRRGSLSDSEPFWISTSRPRMSQNDPIQTFGGSLCGDCCAIIIRASQTRVA
jgi:hypothetical protein